MELLLIRNDLVFLLQLTLKFIDCSLLLQDLVIILVTFFAFIDQKFGILVGDHVFLFLSLIHI